MMATSKSAAGQTARPVDDRFRRLLETFRARLEGELRQFLGEKIDRTRAPQAIRELLEPLQEFVLRGGKRLRPALVEFAYRAAGGEAGGATKMALSIELLHTYLLAHDDIMDGAETRRGGLAAHRVFEAAHRGRGWHGDAARHGEATAILMGDLAHSWAVELFLSTPIAEERRAAAARVFTEMCEEVVLGQYLEMTAPYRRGLDRDDLLDILRLKSGRYSVERPLQLGALLGGAPADLREGLSRYGLALGEAFQLQDDLLGVFGDSDAVGKPVGGDLREGKFTLLIQTALERTDEVQRQTILGCLADEQPSAEHVRAVTALIESSGARTEIEKLVAGRLETARGELTALAIDEESYFFFAGLVEYLAGRKA